MTVNNSSTFDINNVSPLTIGGLELNSGTLTTDTGAVFTAPITLTTNSSDFLIDNSGTLTINNNINGAGTLTYSGAGTGIAINGEVGNTTALQGTVQNTPLTLGGTDTTTTGNQVYNLPISLTNEAKFISTNGSVYINASIDSQSTGQDVTINTPNGTAALGNNGTIDLGNNALGNVSITGARIVLNANLVNYNKFTVTGSGNGTSLAFSSSNPVNVQLTSPTSINSGSASVNGQSVSFNNIHTLVGNNSGSNTIDLQNASGYTVTYTGANSGYINDPIFFTNFNVINYIPAPAPTPVPTPTSSTTTTSTAVTSSYVTPVILQSINPSGIQNIDLTNIASITSGGTADNIDAMVQAQTNYTNNIVKKLTLILNCFHAQGGN